MQSLRILVVDDVQDSATIQAHLVRLWGYEATIASNGPRALELAKMCRPDVVLLDIGLPGMDGYEVARQLRLLPGMSKALLIAITGYVQEADVQRCKEAGIDCHFRKPVEPVALQQVLANAERRYRD
jgi:two-component system CheB/CheR fusion protein